MPRPLIAADAIYERALTLLDTEGVESLTTRRLAAELKISTRTLYQQIGSRDELIRALVARHLSRVRVEFHRQGTWEATAEQWCHRLREALLAHPHLTELMTNADAAPIMDYLGDLIDVSVREGIPPRIALDCSRALVNLTINHTVMEVRASREPKLSRESSDADLESETNFGTSVGWILAGVLAETRTTNALVSGATRGYG
ncbi:TetR/AcrR family transcriptional regulator [Mycobacterium sp. 134]|uniref:TetR/AcrR family transcriptional regulator n=1 Tax=Mycobacterium sp. 134 TaxID=3400425 RepID=UPI003AAFE072